MPYPNSGGFGWPARAGHCLYFCARLFLLLSVELASQIVDVPDAIQVPNAIFIFSRLLATNCMSCNLVSVRPEFLAIGCGIVTQPPCPAENICSQIGQEHTRCQIGMHEERFGHDP